MARYGDKGAYEIGNVRVCTTDENSAEMTSTPEHLVRAARMGAGNTGRKHSAEARANMSAANKGRRVTAETITKRVATRLAGKPNITALARQHGIGEATVRYRRLALGWSLQRALTEPILGAVNG
jgi:hypothetical protein